ncbi:MAG: hypothetical protein RL591_1792 [Planctomycetota bacterium]|jgi:hypothetical protein
MKIAALSLVAAVAASVSAAASASFVEFYTTSTTTSSNGINVDVYTLWARFDGATDTVLNAFNLNRLDSNTTNIFYHKDNAKGNDGLAMIKEFGTWAPQLTGAAVANRPFDSFLTIGGTSGASNTTSADPSWPAAGGGWNRPDVPNNLNVGWYNSNPPSLQGRVGVGANTADSVRLAQFVIDAGSNGGTWNLKVSFNNASNSTVNFATSTFSLPAPGAVALLGLAGFVGRRRR